MKIAIITQPLHGNYGGLLQAYALQRVLENMGHQVEVIEREPFNTRFGHVTVHALRTFARNIRRHRNEPLFPDLKWAHDYPIEGKYTHQFIRKYIHQRLVRKSSEIREGEYDAFVVGSDQVWRPRFNTRTLSDSFLDFTTGWNVKRISYAASFGTDNWEYNPKQEQVCSRLVKSFDALSVREASAVALCKTHFGMDALHVLDPTLLHHAEVYRNLIKDEKNLEKPSLVTYILNENDETQQFIEKLAHDKGLGIVRANSQYENKSLPAEQRIQPPVESWLRKFSQADFIVADSFHACVFSIIFKKQFVALSNAVRGNTRLKSLLGMFGIADHFIDQLSGFSVENMQPIDYNAVDEIIAEWQNKSMDFLQEALA